jgi:hypothetical protein
MEVPLSVTVLGTDQPARLEEMACTCARATTTGTHIHHFLSSEILKSLPADANVNMAVDVERGHILINLDP